MDLARRVGENLEQASPDVLRAMVQAFAEALMSAEAGAICGAPYGVASDERVNRRNGYRERRWDTRAGTIGLAIPRLRQGSYFPDWLLERRRRAEQALISVVATSGEAALVAALEHQSQRIRRGARRRHLAETLGRCATVNSAAVLASVQGLFSATTGDKDHDRAVRVTMLEVLEKAISPETLRDILPVTYTALLDTDQAVRSGGIGLWAACAAAADSLPAGLTELSVPLLNDEYVIVHRTMLDQLPRLALPADLAPKLLPIVLGWVVTYAAKPDPDILELAIWALRSLASDLAEPAQVTGWFGVALAYVPKCRPYDRQRLLTAWWPDELRDHPAWTRAALATAADPELADYYNQRHEPLLQAFMDRPRLLADVPMAEIEPLSTVHGTAFPWRALEPIELLQSAGRWADAAAMARDVETSQPPGEEVPLVGVLPGPSAVVLNLPKPLPRGRPPPQA